MSLSKNCGRSGLLPLLRRGHIRGSSSALAIASFNPLLQSQQQQRQQKPLQQRRHITSCCPIPSHLTTTTTTTQTVTSIPHKNQGSRYLSQGSVIITRTYSSSSSSTTTTPKDDEMSDKPEPTGLIAKSGIELLTFSTPNGFKASIMLEELKEAYGLEYTWQSVNIMKNTQKQPWFTAINPNGRIPAIVDHSRPGSDGKGLNVFEGSAILGYLARTYDRDHRLSFPVDSDEWAEAESWIGWQHGGLGPMQGQANHFAIFARDKGGPYGAQRYVGETERLYGVLDARLAGPRKYVAGAGPEGRFSVADIAILGWADGTAWLGIDLASQFPNVAAWLARCRERPGVQKGFQIPTSSPFANHLVPTNPQLRESAEAAKKYVDEAKEKFGYKYSSP